MVMMPLGVILGGGSAGGWLSVAGSTTGMGTRPNTLRVVIPE